MTDAPDPDESQPRRSPPHARSTAVDPSLAAARYRASRDASAAGQGTDRPKPTADQLRAIAKTSLDLAIERGDFDNLPGAGKPLAGLTGGGHDPDWWIKAKIERENLSGVAPPALSLRTENAELDGLLDSMASESSVRAAVADFNGRIVEARRQLTGGPPVVTPTRDLDAEVDRWRVRHEERRAAAVEAGAVAAALAEGQAREGNSARPWRSTWRERRAARPRRPH